MDENNQIINGTNEIPAPEVPVEAPVEAPVEVPVQAQQPYTPAQQQAPAYQGYYAPPMPPAPARKPKDKKKGLIIAIILILVFGVVAVSGILSYFFYFEPLERYEAAVEDMEDGEYEDAREEFEELGDFKDSAQLISECDYLEAEELMENGDYEGAIVIFEKLGDYEDSAEKLAECNYKIAAVCYENEDYENALTHFQAAGDYSDSTIMVTRVTYDYAIDIYENENRYGDAVALLEGIRGYNDSEARITEIEEAYFELLNDKIIEPYQLIGKTEDPAYMIQYDYLDTVYGICNNYTAAVNALFAGTSYYEGGRIKIPYDIAESFYDGMVAGISLTETYVEYIEILSNPPAKYAAVYNLFAEICDPYVEYCNYVFTNNNVLPEVFKTNAEALFVVIEPYYERINNELSHINTSTHTA